MTTKTIFSLDGKGVNKFVQDAITAYRKGHAAIAEAAVLVTHHAAMHGQPQPMNVLYKALKTNDQTAFRSWLRRTAIALGLGLKDGNIPDGNTAEINNGAYENGHIFTYSAQNGFGVVKNADRPNVKDMKIRYIQLCETEFLAPKDGSGWTNFADRNNFAERRILGDVEAINEALRVINKFVNPPKDNKTTVIKLGDKQLSNFLRETGMKLEGFKETVTASAEEIKMPSRNATKKAKKAKVQAMPKLPTRKEARTAEPVLIQ